MAFLKGEKKEDDFESTPFSNINKSTVFQEAKIFHDSQIKAHKCVAVLTKILFLIYQGEGIATSEATEVFFAITKLFQSQDPSLRRMVYLVIKELSNIAEDVIIVTSSLQKDMNSKTEHMYRANAVRALCKITDTTLIAGIERFLKQAIVDKQPSVASAALVSSIHLFNQNKEVVKRWVNEVQESMNNKGTMVQYHALGLMYLIRQKDRMAVSKLVQSFLKNPLKSPYAQCMLIRYAVKVLEEDDIDGTTRAALTEHLETCLRHKTEMVVFEAAKAICFMKNVTTKELIPAISVLQLFLSSPKQTLRFAAIRTLNRVAITHTAAVSACNLDMETLITDSNRSISTLAITTLLKTGNEASVDRLLKQIEGFMSEISDEFKVVVIEAIRVLVIKFPAKQTNMLNFLANALRDEGGFEYKKAITDTLINFVSELPDCREFALSHLCEFIEDCEHPSLLINVLHLLGKEGPKTQHPTKYIRYIYNRVILENATVRAAATTSLAKFGVLLEDLRSNILVLLRRCMNDNDDEVRDRATFYVSLIEKDIDTAKKYLVNDNTYSLPALEKMLLTYLGNPSNTASPFDAKAIPLVSKEQEVEVKKTALSDDPQPPKAAVTEQKTEELYSKLFATIPEFAHLGPLLKSSKPIQLTEAETEYVTNVVKHSFQDHVVLQYTVKNTLNDQVLENVTVSLEFDSDDLEIEQILPIKRLIFDKPESCFVALRKQSGTSPASSITNTLKFVVKDCDPETFEPDEEGYDDEYALEEFDISVADFMVPSMVSDFKQAWEQLGDANQVTETFQLSMKSLGEAVSTIIDYLGMQPCERTGPSYVTPEKTTHNLLLAGNFLGTVQTLVRCRLAFNSSTGVAMEITVRSTDAEISQTIANIIG